LDIEVTNISKHGFWLFIQGFEFFLSFNNFPWFKDVSINELINVTMPHNTHLYWPDLDIDLEFESIKSPEKYPLISRLRYNKRLEQTLAYGTPFAKRSGVRRRSKI
jgi:hypothetical protein